jgi:hypothetical protein
MSVKHIDLGSQAASIIPVRLRGVTAAQKPDELIAADRVIMIFSCPSVDDVMLGCEIHSREYANDVIEMIARARDYVFGEKNEA